VARLALAGGPAFLERIIDAYVEFLDARPDFRAIALGRHVSEDVVDLLEDKPAAGCERSDLLAYMLAQKLPHGLLLRLTTAVGAAGTVTGGQHHGGGPVRDRGHVVSPERLTEILLEVA